VSGEEGGGRGFEIQTVLVEMGKYTWDEKRGGDISSGLCRRRLTSAGGRRSLGAVSPSSGGVAGGDRLGVRPPFK